MPCGKNSMWSHHWRTVVWYVYSRSLNWFFASSLSSSVLYFLKVLPSCNLNILQITLWSSILKGNPEKHQQKFYFVEANWHIWGSSKKFKTQEFIQQILLTWANSKWKQQKAIICDFCGTQSLGVDKVTFYVVSLPSNSWILDPNLHLKGPCILRDTWGKKLTRSSTGECLIWT